MPQVSKTALPWGGGLSHRRSGVTPDGPEDELSVGYGLGEALPPIRSGVMDEWGHRGRRPMETGFCQRWGVPGGRECPRRHSWTAAASRGVDDWVAQSRGSLPALGPIPLSTIWGN